jgi:hypothetical protein
MITVYGQNRTLDQVRGIPLLTPDGVSPRWKGIRHGELVDVVVEEAESRGWGINESAFSINKDGTDLVGAFDIAIPNVDAPEGTQFSLGIVNNNNRKKSLQLYTGAVVAICSNGMATGKSVLKRMHTSGFRLKDSIADTFDDYLMSCRATHNIIRKLQHRELADLEEEHLLIEAGRKGLMPWSRIGDVDREYHKPRFEEFEDRTSWSLLNAFTYVAKRNSPFQQMEQIGQFRNLLPAGIVIDTDSEGV